MAEKRKNEVSDGEKGKGSRLKGKGRISGDEAPVAPPPPATAVADGGSSKAIIIEAWSVFPFTEKKKSVICFLNFFTLY